MSRAREGGGGRAAGVQVWPFFFNAIMLSRGEMKLILLSVHIKLRINKLMMISVRHYHIQMQECTSLCQAHTHTHTRTHIRIDNHAIMMGKRYICYYLTSNCNEEGKLKMIEFVSRQVPTD